MSSILRDLTCQIETSARLASRIFALTRLRFGFGRGLGFLLAFNRRFPQSSPIRVSIGRSLVLLGLTDAGRLLGVLTRIQLTLLRR